MLTPAKIDEYSYNRIVQIYDKLNIDICADIIRRIEKMGDISQSSKDQLKILVELNGKEIFDEVLIKTSNLSDETKRALQKLYTDMIKDDMKDYKTLYKYRDKEFKLSEKQIRILNKGIKKNNKEIRNFTNSMAFNSKRLFIDAVDEAYLKVASGSFDYNRAIYDSYKEVASKGVKMTDKAGRKVNIDVAIRRSVLTGIQETANDINEETGKILGCDGYEVTAHLGARPTHAIAQGKQYAVSKEDAKKYKVDWWYDKVEGTPVAELWEEPNCRHTVFPIILGISEPVYTKKELNKMKQKTTTLYGERVPLYEANQQMRYIERNIREYKRQVEILKKTNQDYSDEYKLLKRWQNEYNKVSKETGIDKDYSRTRV